MMRVNCLRTHLGSQVRAVRRSLQGKETVNQEMLGLLSPDVLSWPVLD